MSAYQRETHFVSCEQLVKLLPVLLVGYGNPLPTIFSSPAIAFPAWQPLGRAFGHVGAVGDNFNTRSGLQPVQALNNGLQFHAIVGRQQFPAAEFRLFAGRRVPQDATPAAGARIATAGTVREQLHERKLNRPLGHWQAAPIKGPQTAAAKLSEMLFLAINDSTTLQVIG